ncbi:hypothetical protein F7O81_11490 [Neisseria meningitidis]|nr:hypothetical protein [Neisseria meningitidis]MBG8876914.1 hypothetical protein [Neisseria meningitidis]MBG8881183.1 hypothetical protein [Neisseria meningitidis]MBG8924041.1 hypothetical protein [Neisseria meningitidis]MBG8941455.1 hypothetical protein [Neisseria meningitidis]
MAGLAGHRFRGIGGAAGFGRIAWIGGLKPISTAHLYSPSLQPVSTAISTARLYSPSLQPSLQPVSTAISTAISTARLYSHLYSPLVLQCLEQAVSAAAVSGSG